MQISNKQFMLIGASCFLIIAVANLFSLTITYKFQNIFSIIASLASIFFNFLISFMFYSWARIGEISEEKGISEEIEDLLKEVNKNGKYRKNRK